MTTIYQTHKPCVAIHYKNGVLKNIEVTRVDLVLYEGIRHSIPMYEKDIDPKLFIRKF